MKSMLVVMFVLCVDHLVALSMLGFPLAQCFGVQKAPLLGMCIACSCSDTRSRKQIQKISGHGVLWGHPE